MPGVVAYSAEGLAFLRDSSAIPLIIAACERFHGSARTGIAWQFAMFGGDIDADQALQRYIPEASERQRLYRDAQSIWASQMKSQARLGG